MQQDYAVYLNHHPDLGHRVVEGGALYLPSGNIYCCDPFLSEEVNALDKTVPAGQYQVRLALVDLPDWGRRVAIAALIFSENKPVSWQPAYYHIGQEGHSSFRVDAGLACFMDQETKTLFTQAFAHFYQKNPQGNYYDDVLATGFRQNASQDQLRQEGDWYVHYPLPGNPRNIVLFASGLGDGSFTAYWGLDDSSQPAMLVADFGLLPQ